MEDLRVKIGKNLHSIRKERSLSLDRLAAITGVSKAMLGQIERGESNPTVTTLWKIATGLRVSFTSFMEDETPAVSIISHDQIMPLIEDAGKYKVYPLFPFGRTKGFEIFTLDLEPGCRHESEAHNAGVEEYVIVCRGRLDLLLGEETYTIHRGDAARFPADRPHAYLNNTGEPVRVHMMIHYPTWSSPDK
ncbi:MAG: XRE family transcriptional regulator [Peptococcaceae bacterium]|nr:XRE family transcriptional regulator [Peptococcaceae bacterium]